MFVTTGDDMVTALHYANKAVAELIELARADNAEAQYQLGLRYFHGDGIKKDRTASFVCWTKAAKAGHALAQNNLAYQYQMGEAIRQSDRMAAYWYSKAAAQGLDVAQLNLGRMYAMGTGVKRSQKAAHLWYSKAAAQGNVEAEELLCRQEPENSSSQQYFVIFLVVMGILPWALLYAAVLAPMAHDLLGVSKLGLAHYAIPILLPPMLLIIFLWLRMR